MNRMDWMGMGIGFSHKELKERGVNRELPETRERVMNRAGAINSRLAFPCFFGDSAAMEIVFSVTQSAKLSSDPF